MARDLRSFLDAVLEQYGRAAFLHSDPVVAVHRYDDPRDQEVVAFLAASLAFGNVRSVQRSVDRALAPLGDRPAHRLARMSAGAARRAAEGFVHRWVASQDLANLFRMLGAALRRAGGLEALFAAGQGLEHPDVRPGALALVRALRRLAPEDVDCDRRGTRSFLPRVEGPGASKRLFLFLRWMVRRDEVDLGLWSTARPAQLLVPLDTHIARLGQRLGFTARRSPGIAMALEITEALRRVDPQDPVKYDFALTRLGILRQCPGRFSEEACRECGVGPVCRLGA